MSRPSFFEPPFHFTVDQPDQEGGAYRSPDYPKQEVCEVKASNWLVLNQPNSGVAMIYDANDALVSEVLANLPPNGSPPYKYVMLHPPTTSGEFTSQSLCEEAATRWLRSTGGGSADIVDADGKKINTVSTRE